jgi:hypothetical protein
MHAGKQCKKGLIPTIPSTGAANVSSKVARARLFISRQLIDPRHQSGIDFAGIFCRAVAICGSKPGFVLVHFFYNPLISKGRRGGRVAEGGGLLNRYTVISRIVGSNPIPSATYPFATIHNRS